MHRCHTMDRFVPLACWLMPLMCCTAAMAANVPDHAVVPGYERFLSGDTSDEAALRAGRLLLGELNCTSCHEADAALADYLSRKQAPVLDDVGSRVRVEFLRAFLSDPQATKPGTTMPELFVGLDDNEKRDRVEALVHLLASTGRPAEMVPVTPAVKRGEELFHSVGCVACHDPRSGDAEPLAASVPLPDMEAKYAIPGLAEFLRDPLHVRPSGRMPSLLLNEEEARDIASYLLRDLKLPPNLRYAYYEGNWDKLPDFSALRPKEEGTAASFDVNVGRGDHFAVRFAGTMRIDRDGRYTFHLGSDDGSRLLIDGKAVVTNDGIHGFTVASDQVDLTAGLHQIVAEFFEQAGEERMTVEYEGRRMRRQSVEFALVPEDDENEGRDRFVVDPSLVEKGRALFAETGCASCHTFRIEGQTIAPVRKAPALATLDVAKGCLAEEAPSVVPHFALSAAQRNSMAQAIDWARHPPDAPPDDQERIADTLIAMNCYACHSRGGVGGLEEPRNALFRTTQPEMGDEGRVPPPLDGVGDKLRGEWLNHIFQDGARDRPYMLARMPRFGGENVGHLTAALGRADAHEPLPPLELDVSDRRVKASGRLLVGDQGFSCIKCHTFGNNPATGIQSIDMTTMTRRLREDWFRRYLPDPPKYRPGTRMPSAWPEGQVLLPNVLGGDVQAQIVSVWLYLSDGGSAPIPSGLIGSPIELVADTEAIMYRAFIQGAGPRAIGVAYPEKVNLAFDANDLGIALLWHNAFIDASMHWVGRGAGFQSPLGDNVLPLTRGAPFAVLDDAAAPWPDKGARELGYHFRGYRLDDRRQPTFLYTVGAAAVEDFPEPVSSEKFAPLRRTLRISADAPIEHLWYRAQAAGSIERQDDGSFLIDGDWKLRIDSVAEPEVRQSGGRQELLVPIELPEGKARVVIEYHW